ncbi:hypothetical protein E6O75_ATG11428 [Venturia nashicola]|uniref:Uncharacterized protein n=1 Tax=Venturia nashicola TaxID=86259 RepID=A0A4Z1NDL4_9PEZI|nr:hypothetical protein E6O75_ATG11428 [Venturia nashicola]
MKMLSSGHSHVLCCGRSRLIALLEMMLHDHLFVCCSELARRSENGIANTDQVDCPWWLHCLGVGEHASSCRDISLNRYGDIHNGKYNGKDLDFVPSGNSDEAGGKVKKDLCDNEDTGSLACVWAEIGEASSTAGTTIARRGSAAVTSLFEEHGPPCG